MSWHLDLYTLSSASIIKSFSFELDHIKIQIFYPLREKTSYTPGEVTTYKINRVLAARIYKDVSQSAQNTNGQQISKSQEEKSTVTLMNHM